MKKLVIGLLLIFASSSLSAVLAAELDLMASPAFVTVSGKRYAIVQLGNSVTFTTSPSTSATFSWTFANGTPPTGSGNGPFTVTYSSTPAQGSVNDVTFTSTRSSTHNGNPVTCTTTSKVTADVLVPSFTFENDESITSAGITAFVAPGGTVSGGTKLPLGTDVKINVGLAGVGIQNLSSSGGSSPTFNPTSGSTTGSGTFKTSMTTTDDGTDAITVQFSAPSPASNVITSQNVTLVPAVCQDQYAATVYFTTKQDGYPTSPSQTFHIYAPNSTSTIVGTQTWNTTFEHDARAVEGFGKPTTPVESGKPYVYFDTVWHDAAQTLGTGDVVLSPQGDGPGSSGHSAAAATNIFPHPSTIKFTNSSITSAFGTDTFHIVDVGGGVSGRHVDLYWGDDEPTSPGSGLPQHCSFSGDQDGPPSYAFQYVETVIYQGAY